jgi:hypothetical protein
MEKRGIVLIALAVMVVVLVSEGVFTFRNKWRYYSYLLDAAKVVNNWGRPDFAFLITTEGKYKLPDNEKFREDVRNNLNSFEATRNLPTVLYYFAVSSFYNNLQDLTPKLLNLAISKDPNFSFWRVELANYYLLVGQNVMSKQVLADCLKVKAPKAHCQDYTDNNLSFLSPEKVGFLSDSIRSYFEAGGR